MSQITTKVQLDNFIISNWNHINDYIDNQMNNLPVPLTSSVDIRESKYKYAPVDHNIYPAGFNNLCAMDLDCATLTFKKAISKYSENAKRIGILVESHTKNTFYLDNLVYLSKSLRDAGFQVDCVSLDESLFEHNQTELNLISASKFDIKILKLSTNQNSFCEAKNPSNTFDLILLNNDQSNKIDFDWDNIKTPVEPTPKIGWYQRQKINHFRFYKEVVENFCKEFSIDPNLLQANFKEVYDVDYSTKVGLEKVGAAVDELKKDLRKEQKVFIKASKGTYGMGISVVSNGEEAISMNRKVRNKMDIGKNKIKFTDVLVQEGVETILKYDDMAAEVAIYLVDGKSVGGFMRANNQKGSSENLNSRGMVFKKFCISEIRQNQDHSQKEAVYTIVARLATLASAFEIKEVL